MTPDTTLNMSQLYHVWRTTGEVGEEVSRVKKTPFEEVSEEAPSRNLTELQGEPQRAKEEV